MGTVLIVRNLAETPPARDPRFDSYADEDDAFIAWLSRGNAAYRYLGDLSDLRAYIAALDIPKARDYVRHHTGDERKRRQLLDALDFVASDERFASLLAGQ